MVSFHDLQEVQVMTQIVIDVDSKYDKKLGILKIEKEFTTKAEVVVKVIEKFFDENMKLD